MITHNICFYGEIREKLSGDGCKCISLAYFD